MSLPRPILRGTTYLITRRVTGRKFLLKPSRKLNRTIEYLVAVCAQRTGVRVHALTVLSNHWHCVASDPQGRLPEFLRDLHALIAKHVNAALGRWENLWSTEQTSLVRLDGDAAILDKIVYTLANPVSSYLVARGSSWPGLRISWPAKRSPVKRPRGFFREQGPMPEEATLELCRPPRFEESNPELADRIKDAVFSREEELRLQAQKEGKTFLGRRAILRQSPHDRATSWESRRGISPRVAAKNKWRRMEALLRLETFVHAYREAYRRWRQGFKDVLFPAGTYALRVTAGVCCAPT